MLELIESKTSMGGLGCSVCAYWSEYGDMTLELHGLVGKWGRCTNPKTFADVNDRFLTNKTTSGDRVNCVMTRLALDSQYLSTSSAYSCENLRIKKETEDTLVD